ncbi:adenosylcobinamide-GDP ribazoletransferase [Coralliovum pocilloporae]|uniref:adenosylcobinamide-GDP ribazoletransferase n=1 Tax=Coralliovum pocilloporae TaxID=3066369 RepID=UPI0033070DF1
MTANQLNGFTGRLLAAPGDIADQVRFFSRLPVPDRFGNPQAMPAFERGAGVVPLAGLLIGLLPAFTLWLGLTLSLPPLSAAILAIIVQLFLTGALHEDGLADVLDGFWGGMTRERRLEIMKDSRVGSYGVLGLVASLILKTSLLAGLAESASPVMSPGIAALLYLAAFPVSRGPMVWLWHRLGNARASGLSHDAGRPDRLSALSAAGLSVAVGVIPIAFVTSGGAILGLILAFAVAFACASVARRKIGGQTGDVLGACQQCCELAYLLGLVMVL